MSEPLPMADEPERAERCETCRFWREYPGGEGPEKPGACRRFPPTVPLPQEFLVWRQHHVMYPLTHTTDWCGEWQAKPAPPRPQRTGPTPPRPEPDIRHL